jgi:poly-gamma-glutamate capsule biosynthesis protein CapA/YwtB (metallophosphatase superfamily)
MLSIIIGGDIIPPADRVSKFCNGELIETDVIKEMESADFRLFNLETPLTRHNSPIDKQGNNYITIPEAVKGLLYLKINAVCLANNHILDQGEEGLNETISILKRDNINHVGAGERLQNALQPLSIQCKGITVGVYACAEHEFSIATEHSAGANPFDPLESLDHIADLKNKCDYVIVLYHGGKEYYPYPSPMLQKTCRKMALKGADIVICQHSHCIGSMEEYNGSVIVYGQGDFISKCSNPISKQGLLINVLIDQKISVKFIPIIQGEDGVIRMDRSGLDGFLDRSRHIEDSGFVKKQYQETVKNEGKNLLYQLVGFGRIVRRIDQQFLKEFLIKRRLNNKSKVLLRNLIECEAHQEMIISYLKMK